MDVFREVGADTAPMPGFGVASIGTADTEASTEATVWAVGGA